MCQVHITKYSGCGCEIYSIVSSCSMVDKSGNCGGQQRFSRAVQDGVCGRHNCAYYTGNNYRPGSRWALNKPTGHGSLSKKPTHSKPGHHDQEASTHDERLGLEIPRPRAPNGRGPLSHHTHRSLEHNFSSQIL